MSRNTIIWIVVAIIVILLIWWWAAADDEVEATDAGDFIQAVEPRAAT